MIKKVVSTTNLGKGSTKLFYPDSISSQMLLCAHSSCLTCHSGVNQMSIRGFGGPPCAQNKSLIKPTSGLLFRLPFPQSQVAFFSHHFGFCKWHPNMKWKNDHTHNIRLIFKVTDCLVLSKRPSAIEAMDL